MPPKLQLIADIGQGEVERHRLECVLAIGVFVAVITLRAGAVDVLDAELVGQATTVDSIAYGVVKDEHRRTL